MVIVEKQDPGVRLRFWELDAGVWVLGGYWVIP
jgi:hypothetical protein